MAVRTTIGRIKDAVSECGRSVMIGRIRYIDHEVEGPEEGTSNMFRFLRLKRLSYEHEREVRLIVEVARGLVDTDRCTDSEPGTYVPVSPETLVTQVVVSPDAPPWLAMVVQDVTRKYLSTEPPIVTSTLLDRPLW